MKICFGNFKNKLNKDQTIDLLLRYQKLNLKNVGFAVLPEYFDLATQTDLFIMQQNVDLKNIDKSCKGKTFLIGHSDYRKIGESDSLIFKKAKKLAKFGANFVFCCGESLQQMQNGQTNKVLSKQLKKLCKINIKNFVVAYEPIYAIGTGKEADIKDILSAIDHIKSVLPGVKVLYGGSVNSKNASKILSKRVVDGVLVGKSSLDEVEISKIVNYNKK